MWGMDILMLLDDLTSTKIKAYCPCCWLFPLNSAKMNYKYQFDITSPSQLSAEMVYTRAFDTKFWVRHLEVHGDKNVDVRFTESESVSVTDRQIQYTVGNVGSCAPLTLIFL